ncbi:MAG: ABC transporter ATP-binding protein [Clostridia bacterium]|nr:ABC transporter ATP-binding protein [Clostridia bacterium]
MTINPLLIAGAVLGTFTLTFVLAFAFMKEKKEAFGFDRNMKDSVITRRLLRYAKPYVGNFLIVLLVMAVTVASDIILPLIIGDVADILGRENFSYAMIGRDVVIYVAVLLMSVVCFYIQSVILQKTGQKIISSIREETFEHIEKLSHEQLNGIPVGTLVTRVTNDTHSVSMMFTKIIVNLVKNICLILGVLAAMFAVNIKLTLMVLCVAPFVVIFTVIFRKFSRRAYRMVKTNTTDINVFLSENLSGIKVTQIFNQEQVKLEEFDARNQKLCKSKNRQIFVFGIFRPSIYMLYMFSVLALLYIAGNSVLDGVSFAGQFITYSTIVVFYQYISSFFTPIQNLAEQFNVLQSAYASSEKIFTILDMEPIVVDSPDAIELDSIRGEIEFRNVWFAYVGEEWILKDVSFKVSPKQTVALVGPTGAGKSTILSLICRNYDIQCGQILIDGIDIRKIKISSLRRHFGQMLQDVFIFSGTVRSNIVLRDESISDEAIMEACRQVNADHFINKLEKGLDEEVRERGNNFSAGERQLLSFVRTIVHKPEIMILDEATANIDTETEVLIQDSLEHMMNIGTMLMVAHRLSTIQHADNIIVMADGRIVEQGTHQELLALRGRYYDLYQLQFYREQMSGAQ